MSSLQTLHEIRRRRLLKNTYQATVAKFSDLDKLAIWITDRIGTMGFF